MNNEKLISVVMGIYNCADTLPRAVKSIENQTYTNWELIMCDDGSQDNTYQIACELAQKDSRIKVLRNEENLTLAPTLNKCIEYSQGEYIARMDGDDLCDCNRFQKEYDFLENNKEYAVVSCLMELFDDEGVYRTVNYIERPTAEDLANSSPFCHAGCMIRRCVLNDVGLYSTESKHYRIEDYQLWTKLYEKGYKGYNIQEVLYSMCDDRNAFARRNWRNRCNESNLKQYICSTFKLPLKSRIQVLIPIIKYFVPSFIYKYLHKNL